MSGPTERKPRHEAIVEAIRSETPSVKAFRIRLPEGVPFSFTPGQFVMTAFPSDPLVARAYSLASSPLEAGAFEIAFAKAGAFTAKMFELKPGDKLLVEGPYGRWTYRDDVAHAVLISGGTGITPFRSMARYVQQKRLPNKLTILYSSKTPEDIVFRRELEELAKVPNFKIVHTITRPDQSAAAAGWKGRTGRIGLPLIQETVPQITEATYYMCGPISLIEELSKALTGAGVPKERIRYEKWGEY